MAGYLGTKAVFLSTTAASVTGNITVGGTVDGRDIAADGTKLDTIETNADVTDTANVTAAGALMDSEVTNLAAVKSFDPADYATAAQGTLADSAVQPNDSPSFAGLTVDTNTLYVDSTNNRLGIGTTSPSSLIHASGAAASGGAVEIRLEDTAASSNSRLMRTGSAYSYAGVGANETWLYHAGAGTINIGPDGAGAVKIVNNGAERVRIDSSGNLLVGKTAESGGTAGHFFSSTGYQRSTRNGSIQILNRISTDGPIIDFQRDGSAVGSIGTASSRLAIGTGNVGAFFASGNIGPWNTTTNTSRGDAIDLGSSSGRWKDLYLSGSISDGTNSATVAQLVGGSAWNYAQTNITAPSSITSTSFVDVSGYTVTITPSSASSKILLMFQISTSQSGGDTGMFRVLRGATLLPIGNANGGMTRAAFMGAFTANDVHTLPYLYIDSPATTSATTYKLQARSASGTVNFNKQNSTATADYHAIITSSLIAIEVPQ